MSDLFGGVPIYKMNQDAFRMEQRVAFMVSKPDTSIIMPFDVYESVVYGRTPAQRRMHSRYSLGAVEARLDRRRYV